MLFFRTANFQQLTLFSQSQFLFIIQQLALLIFEFLDLNPLSANPTKWSSTLKQFVGNFPTNYLRVFDHFVGLALKGLKYSGINRVLQDSETLSIKYHDQIFCIKVAFSG